MTETVDRFDLERLGRLAYEVAKRQFPDDQRLRGTVRSQYFTAFAACLRFYPPEKQALFLQTWFDRKSVLLPNSLRLARFLVTLNNPGQQFSLQPDQTTDPVQMVREYFQNVGHPLMQEIKIVQRLYEVEGEESRVGDRVLSLTADQLLETAKAHRHEEALIFVHRLTGEVTDSSSPATMWSRRFMRRYAQICGGAIMVQALAKDNKQDPSFAVEPLIKLHERGYLVLGPILTVAEKQPWWRSLFNVGPARKSAFMLYGS